MRSIAREAGCSPAAPYLYFDGKSDLLAALRAEGFRDLAERIERGVVSVTTPRAKLEAVIRAYLKFGADRPELYRLMFDEIDFAKHRGDPTVLGVGRALFELYRDLYARGVASGAIRSIDPELQALISWSAIHGFAMLALAGRMPPPRMPSADRDAMRDAFLGFMGDALRP